MDLGVGVQQLRQAEPVTQRCRHRVADVVQRLQHEVGALPHPPGWDLAGGGVDADQSGTAHHGRHGRLLFVGPAHDLAAGVEHHEVRVGHLELVAEDADLADEDALNALAELRLPESDHEIAPEEGDVEGAGAVGQDHLQTLAPDLVGGAPASGGSLHVRHLLHPGHHRDVLTGLEPGQIGGLGAGQVTAWQVAQQIGHRMQLQRLQGLRGGPTHHFTQRHGQSPEDVGTPSGDHPSRTGLATRASLLSHHGSLPRPSDKPPCHPVLKGFAHSKTSATDGVG